MILVANALILKNCRLLLFWDKDHWKLPGGKVEARESLTAALIRELQEEIGQTAKIMAVHSTLTGKSFSGLNIQATHFWVNGLNREQIVPQGEHVGSKLLWASTAHCRGLIKRRECSAVLMALLNNLIGLGVIK